MTNRIVVIALLGVTNANHILLAKEQLSLMDMDIQSPYVMIALIDTHTVIVVVNTIQAK